MRTDVILRDKKTGRLFRTLKEAAVHYGLSHQTIWNYVHIRPARPAGTNPPIEGVSVKRLSAEIKALNKRIKDLENGIVAQPVPCDSGVVFNGILDCDPIEAL